jgi:hypothetical protein
MQGGALLCFENAFFSSARLDKEGKKEKINFTFHTTL